MKTCPGRRASSSRSLNSVAVRLTSSPFFRAEKAAGSISRSPRVRTGSSGIAEADDDVHGVAFGREHDDRYAALRPDLPADLVPVELGQHDVEHHEVESLVPELHEAVTAVARGGDPEAGLREAEARDLADRRVVFNEQNAFVHALILTDGRVGFAFETLGSLALWRFRAKKS